MDFSISEIVVVLLVALIVIKPDQLPDVAFTLGKFARTLRQMISKVKDEMNDLVDVADPKGAERKAIPEKPTTLSISHEVALTEASHEPRSEQQS